MKVSAVYPSITMPQRLRAMVSAFARSDSEELDKLENTSRDGCYSLPKVKFHFRSLSHLAALHNSFLLEPCTVWLWGQTLSTEEIRILDEQERHSVETSRVQAIAEAASIEAASIEAAFSGRIAESGISADDWQSFRERLLDPGPILLLRQFLCKTAGHETPALVAQYKDAIEGYVFKDAA